MTIGVGADSVLAVIDARVQGLVLDTSWVRHADMVRFASRGERDPRLVAGVAREVRIGDVTLTNVSVNFAPQPSADVAVLGLDDDFTTRGGGAKAVALTKGHTPNLPAHRDAMLRSSSAWHGAGRSAG